MVKKRKTKAKAKTKARRAPARTPKRVASSKPMSKAHDATLKIVNRALAASEALGAKVVSAEEKVEASMAKVEKAMRAANRKKTALAKRAVVTARNAVAKAKTNLAATRAKAREIEQQLKDAVKGAETIRKKEEAKAKAVDAFIAKWERSYERKTTKKARTKKKRRVKTKTAAMA